MQDKQVNSVPWPGTADLIFKAATLKILCQCIMGSSYTCRSYANMAAAS